MLDRNNYQIISLALDQIDPDLHYKDLAKIVAEILKQDYGKHNFTPFVKELVNELKK